jgi:hypothetical protein
MFVTVFIAFLAKSVDTSANRRAFDGTNSRTSLDPKLADLVELGRKRVLHNLTYKISMAMDQSVVTSANWIKEGLAAGKSQASRSKMTTGQGSGRAA